MGDPDLPADDVASPKTQRRLWRRVWIAVAVFVLLAPVLLWVAIDQSGKRAWRETQARLQAQGEATTLAELDLPSRETVPDEENFCALAALTVDLYGKPSAAMIELGNELEIFDLVDAAIEDATGEGATGAPLLGSPIDWSLWQTHFEEHARTRGRKLVEFEGGSAAAFMLAQIEGLSDVWSELDAARQRPHAVPVAMWAERGGTIGPLSEKRIPRTSISRRLRDVLSLRVRAALATGDTGTAFRGLEIFERLREAAEEGRDATQFLEAVAVSNQLVSAVIHALWMDDFAADDVHIARLQAMLESFDFSRHSTDCVRFELTMSVDSILWMERNRALAAEKVADAISGWGGGSGDSGHNEAFIVHRAPAGYFFNNAVYVSELCDRTLLACARKDGSLAEMYDAAKVLTKEARSLTGRDRWYYLPSECVFHYGYEWVFRYAMSAGARRRQGVLACALYRYRLDHGGRFPESLDALVPGFLADVPLDPIDDKPMRYVRSADAPGGFRLWSIGFDGADDGGTLNLDAEIPWRTSLFNEDYQGDWPWPVVPLVLPSHGDDTE